MHKKAIALLMTMSMLFFVTGCDPQDSNGSDDVGNTSNIVTESSVTGSSEQSISEDTDDTVSPDASSETGADANTSDNETGDTDSSQQETEQSNTPMQVQDNLDVNLSEGEEGAW